MYGELSQPIIDYNRRRHAAMSTEQHEKQRERCCASNDQCSSLEREQRLSRRGSTIGLDKERETDGETQARLHKHDVIKWSISAMYVGWLVADSMKVDMKLCGCYKVELCMKG